jgi:protein-S-isoprenylcysteine O-methyltransferase Ste14
MPASSRLPELGSRGEGWVALQLVLFVLVALSAAAPVEWPERVAGTLAVAGLILIGAGLLLLVAAVAPLVAAKAMTTLPRPRPGGVVAVGGVYGLVRHPIYGAILVLAVGAALVGSPLALVPAAVLAGVFDLKARLEEAWLEERDQRYAEYRARITRRFVPGIY